MYNSLMPTGRPSEFTEEKAATICELLMRGNSLRKICSLDDMPEKATVFNWLHKFPSFFDQYTRARQVQAEHLADEIFDVSDDDSKDVSGELEMPNGVAVQRSRLMVDTRKWYLSKVLPKIYGDKVLTEHTGKDGGPIQFVTKSILEE
jgi:hypothetical protein